MNPVLRNNLKNVGDEKANTVHIFLHEDWQVLNLLQHQKSEPFQIEEDDISAVSTNEETRGLVNLHKGLVGSLEGEAFLWRWRRKGLSRTSADHRGHGHCR
jgi:hypothetical protein